MYNILRMILIPALVMSGNCRKQLQHLSDLFLFNRTMLNMLEEDGVAVITVIICSQLPLTGGSNKRKWINSPGFPKIQGSSNFRYWKRKPLALALSKVIGQRFGCGAANQLMGENDLPLYIIIGVCHLV